MSVLPAIPRRLTRSRWFEPIFTAVGALILGLGFSGAAGTPSSNSGSLPPTLPNPTVTTRANRAGNPRELVALVAHRRIRLLLTPPPLPSASRIYHIQWGDTLWSLAERFHVSVNALEAANHLTSSQIDAGESLVIPQSYQVRPGDTLASIARKFSVPLVLLWHENRLKRDKLTAGENLIIPYLGRVPHADYSAPPIKEATLASAPVVSRGISEMVASLTPNELLMLAHLVQAEAGNQSFLGQVAVAAVVLNRLKTPGFPKTLDGVIFDPGQFASVSNGSFWQVPRPLAMMAAKAAASGWDPTHGALYYYNPSLPHAAWMTSLPTLVTIGQQVFCQ